MTNYEKLLDEECLDNIEIVNSKGETFILEQLALIPYKERLYALLKPIDFDKLGMEEDDALVFFVDEEKEDISLCLNEVTIEKIFELYESNN